MSSIARCASALLLLLAAACAGTSEQRVPFPSQDVTTTSPDVTRIYFLRDGGPVLQNRPIKVLENDREIGELTSGTYLCWERAPGRMVARAFYESLDPGRGKLEGIGDLNCHAGRAHYFNVTIAREWAKPTVTEIDPEEGRKLIAQRKPAGS
jgi:hypothetical protein